MNLLDRTISYISPRAGLMRARARTALSYAERLNYEGAKSGSRTDGWISGSTDQNAELGTSLYLLRNRSRDLLRNNPHAVKAVSELVDNSVGTGIVPRARTGDTKLDRVIDNEWSYFAESCDSGGQMDFYGMQALLTRSTAESGDGLIRFRPRLPQDKLRIPLQLQILESDYLDANRTMGTVGTPQSGGQPGVVIQGVEFDWLERRIAYWLFNRHPGSVAFVNPRGGILSQPVPADQVLHCYRILRPGQVRGVPWLAPVMMAMKDLDDYADAERVRKKIEACVVALVTEPTGEAGGVSIGVASTDSSTGQRIESFQPGMVDYLRPGQDVRFNNPPVTQGYQTFKTAELQAIGAGIGVPYEMISGDLSQVNYSSFRAGLLGFRGSIEAFRWLMLMPMICNPVWRKFIDTLVLLGKIPEANYAVQWTAPKFESVDPLKDATAELHRMRAGTLPLYEAIVQQGMDPEETLDEYAKSNRELDKRGIVLDSDPRNTSFRGVEQKPDSGEVVPEGKPGEGVQPGQVGKSKPAQPPAIQGRSNPPTVKNSLSRDWKNPSRFYFGAQPPEPAEEIQAEPEVLQIVQPQQPAIVEPKPGPEPKPEPQLVVFRHEQPPAAPPASANIKLTLATERPKRKFRFDRDKNGLVKSVEELEPEMVFEGDEKS